uniref:Uncharacterized protein n=1 Tax=Knipowitschia caucasica TaxID=637954 RepID=A0AAV2LC97_KNICA
MAASFPVRNGSSPLTCSQTHPYSKTRMHPMVILPPPAQPGSMHSGSTLILGGGPTFAPIGEKHPDQPQSWGDPAWALVTSLESSPHGHTS